MGQITEQDKQKVLDWMMRHCLGYRNARTRAEILPFLQMPDREFRLCASELIHEGHLCSSASHGYWAIPLCTKDPDEVEAALDAQKERKAKALDLLADCDRAIKYWEDRKRCLTEQQEFVGMER